MTKNWWYKLIFLAVMLVSAVLHVIPTLMPNKDIESFFVQKRINLGLDLQGGLYMIMGVDFPTVFSESLDRSMNGLKEEAERQKIAITSTKLKEGGDPIDPVIQVQLVDKAKQEAFRAMVKDKFAGYYRIILQDESGLFELAYSSLQLDQMRKQTVGQSIEVIRNRIDELGVNEPVITPHGTEKILVELPGEKDIERAKSIIGQTAKLEFKIVAQQKAGAEPFQKVIADIEEANKEEFTEEMSLSDRVRKLNAMAKGKIPEDTTIAFERQRDPNTGEVLGLIPYLLETSSDVTGEDLESAQVQPDPETNFPSVSLNFNVRGSAKFDNLAEKNYQRQLAIVLDGVVHSAPVLQTTKFGGRAKISMGSGDYQTVMKEATDLAIVLRAGALPAKLAFEEQRVVGPSLGADSIEAGEKASLIALGLVLFFMLIYYKISGLIANVALSLNAMFIFSILVGLEATLTLPGIAGIALTIGMAVDANVIIYERIREELRNGKSPVAALEQGFARAIRTILDANITTAVAALVLMEFGSGPVRGFAVTLMIGIVTSLFTAVFVSRLIFDWWLTRPSAANRQTISI